MLSKKAINQFRKFSKDWPGVDYSKLTDEEVSVAALIWLGQSNNKKHYNKRKRTKLFYLAVARLRIAKPEFSSMTTIKTRFGLGYIRTFNLIEELETAGILKKYNLKHRETNINWEMVKKIRIPKYIMEEAKKMKPMRGYSYTENK